MDFKNEIEGYFSKLCQVVTELDVNELNSAMNAILDAYHRDATIYIFGNGGSAATASHFVCDFNKGICEKLSRKFRLICLNDNTPTIMAIANDISYDDIFYMQLKQKLAPNDLVIAISGSGNSKNVIKAVEYSKKIGTKVIGLSGFNGGKLKLLADFSMHVDINDMQIVEDIHMVFDHMMMKIFYKILHNN